MNGLPYYRAFPRDFIEGTIGMPFEVKCAYRVVLDLIYMQNGRLPDDSRYIAGLLGCTPRKWTSIRGQLIDLGKLRVVGDHLQNVRANAELGHLNDYRDSRSQNARSRVNKTLNQETKAAKASGDAPDADLIRAAIRAYNEAAATAGWPQMQKITKPRVTGIRARMKEVDGIEGWRAAVTRAADSAFLTGQTDRRFAGFSIDWIIKAANFTKLMEGNYDDRPNGPKGPGGKVQARGDRVLEQIARSAKSRPPSGDGGSGTGGVEP